MRRLGFVLLPTVLRAQETVQFDLMEMEPSPWEQYISGLFVFGVIAVPLILLLQRAKRVACAEELGALSLKPRGAKQESRG